MMKRILAITALAVSLAAGAFAGGTWWAHRSGAAHASAHAATVYTCPMHPDYRSDHPGDCPMCGMRLEAVPADATTGGDAAARALPHGAVQVSPERQQAIGVRVGVVSRSAGTRLLRTTGRVVADENRTYPIVAAVSGWIRNVESVATGDVVKKDQVLASFFAPDPQFEMAQQSVLQPASRCCIARRARNRSASHDSGRALELIERVADGLRNLGVSNSQIREMAKRREIVHDIRVESPVDGVVLKRSVMSGLRFERGFEFYRIADLNRVWILADVYGHQLPFIRRGASARITTRGGEPGAVGDGESVGAALRRGDADAEGAARGGEPASGTQAGHVRRRGVPRPPAGGAPRAGGCDCGLGAAQNGVRRVRQRALRAPAGRDGLAHR